MWSTTCDTIMAELDNWRYDAASYQTIRYLSDRPHKVPHTIPKIYSKSRTNYKQQSKISFILLFVELLPTSHSTKITPTRFSALIFRLKVSLTNVNRISGYWYEVAGESPQCSSKDLQICCAYPRTTKYWKWWTRVKEY